MKILFLNHYIDAQHKITARLQSAGAIVLNSANAEEAWKMIQIHGTSLDLAILHRESKDGAEDEGEKLLARIKAEPAQADLPVILTSSLWSEADFFQHQQGPHGVNAYLSWPFTDDQLIETIETMFGNSIRFAAATVTDTKRPQQEFTKSSVAIPDLANLSIVLEEAGTSDRIAKPQAAPDLKFEDPNAAQGSALDISIEGALPTSEAPAQPQAGDPSGISLVAPSPGFSLEPVGHVGLTDAPAPDLSTEISKVMNEELEPHERLELNMQLKASNEAAAAPALQIDTGPVEVEGGTMVLDPADMGIAPAEPASNSQISNHSREQYDDELASDLPYLFNKKPDQGSNASSSALVFSEPVGDAVIPGGAVNSPDSETLKKYLMLREQDVAILSNQLKAARDHIAQLEKKMRDDAGKAGDLEHMAIEQQRRIEEFEKEKALALQGLQGEIDELRFQNKSKADKARLLEAKVNEATEEIERLKDRVRTDIRKIRVREKELENKLEILRKDSEALITARESKIMELKRKIDLLEFNIDLLQDQNTREKENSARLRERLAKAAQVVRVAGGLLDAQGKQQPAGMSDLSDAAGADKKGEREAS